MDQSISDRLKSYLAQLPPQAQALLLREFEKAHAAGKDLPVTTLVLDQLHQIIRIDDSTGRARSVERPERIVFRPLEPFLVDGDQLPGPGEIRRTSLDSIWLWLTRDVLPDASKVCLEALDAAENLSAAAALPEAVIRFRAEVVVAIAEQLRGGRVRISSPQAAEDLPRVAVALQAAEALQVLGKRLPGHIRVLDETQVAAVFEALNLPSLQGPAVIPFALSVVMGRLGAPWQMIRLPISLVRSDDEIRVAASPYGVAVTMALRDLGDSIGLLQMDLRHGRYNRVLDHLKALNDGVRGIRTELDLRQDSQWGRHLVQLRKAISEILQSEIGSAPGRVRRLLRQRPDKEITPGLKLDSLEVDEAVGHVAFVASCRAYAAELAINEVTGRTFSEMQQYVERTLEALLETLRVSDGAVLSFRQAQAVAAIRLCEPLFGADYSALMARAVESAASAERKTKAKAKAG